MVAGRGDPIFGCSLDPPGLCCRSVPSAMAVLLPGLLASVAKVLQLSPLLGVGQDLVIFLHYRNLRISAPGHWLRRLPENIFYRVRFFTPWLAPC